MQSYTPIPRKEGFPMQNMTSLAAQETVLSGSALALLRLSKPNERR